MSVTVSQRSPGKCPICRSSIWFAAGRGFCGDCMMTFPQPRQSRAALVATFMQRFYMSKRSGFYHREGCKYLGNVDPENLIETSEPWGRPCKCVR